MNIFIRSSRHP